MDFSIPVKTITTPEHLAVFQSSEACRSISGFILNLQEAVLGSNKSSTPATNHTIPVVNLLETINLWVDQVPPIPQPQRYGNKAFGVLQRKIESEGRDIICVFLQSKEQGVDLIARHAQDELNVYLANSFGDPIRIDFGTGHELNFLAFIMSLFSLNYFEQSDLKAIVHHVFWKYLTVMRKIQALYKLEPAGSHGVWGLDDYHFLPFIFGAAELVGHPQYGPSSIHDEGVLSRESSEFLYFHCIHNIRQAKTSGHFGEHSPMLNDISAVPSWEKVAGGLVKMYKTEVMNKFPVMKHFFFGSIIRFVPS